MERYVKSPNAGITGVGSDICYELYRSGHFRTFDDLPDVLGSFYSSNKSRLAARTSISGHCMGA